ncbi:Gfo/Idh/MocA family protein [Lichenicoccus sp.]|uniref:Gfo/Idh/MocA family protein n=1 Tax=Lichenicoccus sp. TaxID=2781899 RepID=UPI003D09FCA1
MSKPAIGVGLIGSGFMGRSHSLAYLNVDKLFELPFRVELRMLADQTEAQASRAADAFGFARATGDWRELVADSRIEVVSITTPNRLHKDMALAAIDAGKHVWCEKPLAPTLADARIMAEAARHRGVRTAVGFNYLKNPMMRLARDMIAGGEIGEVRTFRGIHAEDFMADVSQPWSWRLDPANGGGALVDIGSHIIAAARYLLGPIVEVDGRTDTLVTSRPIAAGAAERRTVAVDDVTTARLRFRSGVVGTIEANWLATGRTMQHAFEIAGSAGSIAFSQERFNELQLYCAGDEAARRGFRTIVAGPEHEPYGAFCVAPGHQIGFNDLKAIEARDFLLSIADDAPRHAGLGHAGLGHAGFDEGVAVLEVVDAIYRSARDGGQPVAIGVSAQ